MQYGQGDDESIITEYMDSHLEGGIKQKNLDKVLDLIDMYADLKIECGITQLNYLQLKQNQRRII